MLSAPTVTAAPKKNFFMLFIIPPFCADRFSCPPFGSPSPWSFFLAAPFSSPALQMQTLRQRKVAAVRENKRPQLFGGFVFVALVFRRKSARAEPARYPETRLIFLIDYC